MCAAAGYGPQAARACGAVGLSSTPFVACSRFKATQPLQWTPPPQVDFLRARDANKGAISFVDVASPSYSPQVRGASVVQGRA